LFILTSDFFSTTKSPVTFENGYNLPLSRRKKICLNQKAVQIEEIQKSKASVWQWTKERIRDSSALAETGIWNHPLPGEWQKIFTSIKLGYVRVWSKVGGCIIVVMINSTQPIIGLLGSWASTKLELIDKS
jgi:hypothetical protein